MGVCRARTVASWLEQLPVSSENKVSRLLQQHCTVAEVTNRIYKGQIWLRIAAKTLNSCTGIARRSAVLSALHTTGPRANCKLLDQTCLTGDSFLCNSLVVLGWAFCQGPTGSRKDCIQMDPCNKYTSWASTQELGIADENYSMFQMSWLPCWQTPITKPLLFKGEGGGEVRKKIPTSWLNRMIYNT